MGLEKSLLDNLAKIRGNGVPNYESLWNINLKDNNGYWPLIGGLLYEQFNHLSNPIQGNSTEFNGAIPTLSDGPATLINSNEATIFRPIQGTLSKLSSDDVIKMTKPALSEVFGDPFNKKWVKKTTKEFKKNAEIEGDTYVEPTKPSFEDSVNKSFKGANALTSAANAAFTAIAGERSEFSGKEGALAKSLDSTYDTIQDAVSLFGPFGKAASLAMGVGKLVGNIAGKLGGGTDGMTKLDSILGSPFFLLSPFGLINGFGGKKSDTFAKDNELFSTMGSSYGGASDMADNALAVSGKKYGAFSSGALSEANQAIAEALRQQTMISRINTEAQNRQALQSSMAGTNYNRYSLAMQGGYDQSGVRVGRFGMVFEKNLQRAKNVLKAQKGKSIKNKQNRNLEELINYAKELNPRFIQRLSEPPKGIKFKDDDGNLVQGSHYLEWGTDDNGNGIVYPRILEINGELKFLSSDEAYKNAIKNKNFLVMTPEEADLFSREYKKGFPKFFENFDSSIKEFKEGGNIGSIIKPIKPIFKTEEPVVQEFKEGGSFNVIPEGALHARKHNMDIEGITSKGIPVVSQAEGGEIEQQAEIEREEIIYRLETTKKLEELYKKYNSEEYTLKEKDEFAIEAGKLLVYETLYNTLDNTGLIENIK